MPDAPVTFDMRIAKQPHGEIQPGCGLAHLRQRIRRIRRIEAETQHDEPVVGMLTRIAGQDGQFLAARVAPCRPEREDDDLAT